MLPPDGESGALCQKEYILRARIFLKPYIQTNHLKAKQSWIEKPLPFKNTVWLEKRGYLRGLWMHYVSGFYKGKTPDETAAS